MAEQAKRAPKRAADAVVAGAARDIPGGAEGGETGSRWLAAEAIGVELRLMDQRRRFDRLLGRQWREALERTERRLVRAAGPLDARRASSLPIPPALLPPSRRIRRVPARVVRPLCDLSPIPGRLLGARDRHVRGRRGLALLLPRERDRRDCRRLRLRQRLLSSAAETVGQRFRERARRETIGIRPTTLRTSGTCAALAGPAQVRGRS